MKLYLSIILLLLTQGLMLTDPGLANDELGIYWDTGYTENTIQTDTFPSVLTGYLVLKDPTSVLGVSGWECCLAIEGPAIFVSWFLEGQTINLETPPCFQVGISDPPLPGGSTTLLATFMTMVSEELPVTFSLEPLFDPSLPGQMTYTPADDPGSLLPMTSVTGNPEAAWINKDIPLLDIDRDRIRFDDTIVGYPMTEILNVSNLGYTDQDIVVAFSDTSGVFSLAAPANPVTVPARGSVPLEVKFDPADGNFHTCTMDLGGNLPTVLLEGRGLAGTISWDMPEQLDFGNLVVGDWKWGYLTIVNTGDVIFPVDPALSDTCTAFRFTFGPAPTELEPGDSVTIQFTFEPLAEQDYSCALTLGQILPDVTLTGTGCIDCVVWTAPSDLLLGDVTIGSFAETTFSVSNDGTIPFFVDPTLPDTCGEFSITSGAGLIQIPPGAHQNVSIRFAPVDVGPSTCTLDLGDVVPPVALSGTGQEPQVLWKSPAQLNFGEVAVGINQISSFRVENIGDLPFSIDVQLPGTCPEYELTLGERHWDLDPGTSKLIGVRFTPTILDTTTCLLDLGAVVPPVLLTGVGVEAFTDWRIIEPSFPPTGVGENFKDYLYVHNTGSLPFLVDPALNSPCPHFVLTGASRFIDPGEIFTSGIDFRPVAPGSLSCVLDLGTGLPDVLLQGVAFPRPEGWEIEPLFVDYPLAFIGEYKDEDIEFHNTGGTTLSLDIRLDPPNPHLSIVQGDGQADVLPGYTHDLTVRFEPLVAGTDSTAVLLGAAFAPVPVTGVAEDSLFACLVQPDTLDFGTPVLGETVSLTFGVTNTGNQPLELAPQSGPPQFSVASEPVTLDPGQVIHFVTTFFPDAPGDHVGLVDLGPDACLDVVCQGTVPASFLEGENRIGMFFDPGFTEFEFQTTTAPEVVTGYLVLSNPSETTGVGAWECAYDVDGNAQFLDWQFEGQAINAGSYNNLIVGIGGTPLPYGPTILLATFQLLVPEPTEIQELGLRPTQFPSIPGQMAWAPGGQVGVLLPMLPITGQETVAWINNEFSPVDITAPLGTGLLANVPNPFNPSTRIRFELASAADVRITVYDVTGRSVVTVTDEFLEAGSHTRIWQGRDSSGRQVPSGSYFVRMVTGNVVDVRKVLLLK